MSSTRRFSDSHEWFEADGDIVTVGITRYATDELTDITYVEMKPTGTVVQAGEPLGEVESVKTTSEVYSVVSGEIVDVNQAVQEDPAMLNGDPQGEAWLVKIKASDLGSLGTLMDQGTYDAKHPVG